MPPQATSPTATGHALLVKNLFAGYQQIPVVRDLNLEVAPGEVVALLGPNGAGKTTTLETIAGLNRPISGVIEMSGEYVGGTPAHVLARRGLALVPEGRALFPGLTVREHLRLAGGRNGAGERELLEMLPELEKCLHRKAGLLSGGEQQMLAIGRALVTRPRLLLVDEMSIGLAPVIVERLLPILRLLLHIDRLALVGEGGVSGDDEEPRQPRNCRRDLLDHAVDEIVLLGIAGQVLKRQDRERWLVRERQRSSAR